MADRFDNEWEERAPRPPSLDFESIPDLSVQDVETMEALHNTRWFASVVFPISLPPMHGELVRVEARQRLAGRMPSVVFDSEGMLNLVFNIESGNDQSREKVRAFGQAVARLCGSPIADVDSVTRIGYIEDPLGLLPIDYDAIKHL